MSSVRSFCHWMQETDSKLIQQDPFCFDSDPKDIQENRTLNGKTTCKEVCSNCKCTIIEKPIKKEEKKKEQCVATIVGVLQLPDNFCCPQQKEEEKKENDCGACEETECVNVYRDLGECLQKCIIQSTKGGKKNDCDIGTCGSTNGSSKTTKSKNGC